MCTCPADAFNSTSMAQPLPLWPPSPVRTESLGSSTPVDRWLINQSQFECWWTVGHSSCVFWLPGAERPGKVEQTGVIAAARPLVAAMLTVIFAYLVIRNLIGWHRNLPTGGGPSAALAGGPLRPRRRWRDDGDWIDYFADDSDSLDPAAVEDDHDRLFIVGAFDSGRLLGLPAEPALCVVTYQEELEEAEEDVSIQLCDVTSLSSDGCWSSSGAAESLAVTGRESPLHPTLLICSPLTACYVCRPDGNNNNNSSSSSASTSDSDEFEFRSISSARSFATASSSMSISFSDAVSDCSWEFETASSG